MTATVLSDLIDLLTDQHARLEATCSTITQARADDHHRLLDTFRRQIHRHLDSARAVVYPAVRDHTGPAGPALARAWTAQEQQLHDAATALATLTATDPRLAQRLAAVQVALHTHATYEEHEVFPQLRRHIPAQKLHLMANETTNRQALT